MYKRQQGIEGVWGAIPKAQLKSRLDKLMQLLSQPGPAAAAPQYSQAPAFASASPDLEASVPPASQTSFGAEYPQSPSSQPAAIPVQVHNSTGYAVASLILGIAGLKMCIRDRSTGRQSKAADRSFKGFRCLSYEEWEGHQNRILCRAGSYDHCLFKWQQRLYRALGIH